MSTSKMTFSRPVSVRIDRSLVSNISEIRYTFETILRIAGFPYELGWHDGPQESRQCDIYYGMNAKLSGAAIRIPASPDLYKDIWTVEPVRLDIREDLTFLDFGERPGDQEIRSDHILLARDIVFGSFWLLLGPQESRLSRDRFDNLNSVEAAICRLGLLAKPLVSEYGAWLGKQLEKILKAPAHSWAGSRGGTFSLSHDVDYPEIIRSIECFRILKNKGLHGLGLSMQVLRGRSHFWKFLDWVALARELGMRTTFYFMARRGSLMQYALGTPDAFYDIGSRRFRSLFSRLKDEGCEIGLHASFHAHQSEKSLREEKARLEMAAGDRVDGNRHHYWHLDPNAPHSTLRKLENVGFAYDSSLAFEMSPGFRRGICHPFFPYDPVERRPLNLVELPPAWMDDHFHRRRSVNGIEDPESFALKLLNAANATGGIVLVDYHVRGMNEDFFPEYGPWLKRFLLENLDSKMHRSTPRDITSRFLSYNEAYLRASVDCTS